VPSRNGFHQGDRGLPLSAAGGPRQAGGNDQTRARFSISR
jgi:hypothetical protein